MSAAFAASSALLMLAIWELLSSSTVASLDGGSPLRNRRIRGLGCCARPRLMKRSFNASP